MKKFSGKFEQICERVLERGQSGGYLNGDYVRIKKNALRHSVVSHMSDPVKKIIEAFIKNNVTLRVSCLKSGHSDPSHGPVDAAHIPSVCPWADVVLEYAPGMWREPLTLPVEVLEHVTVEGMEGYPQYSEDLVRPNNSSEKIDKKAPGTEQTLMGDPNRNLQNKNIGLGMTKDPPDGRSQTKLHENSFRAENELIMEGLKTNNLVQTIIKTKDVDKLVQLLAALKREGRRDEMRQILMALAKKDRMFANEVGTKLLKFERNVRANARRRFMTPEELDEDDYITGQGKYAKKWVKRGDVWEIEDLLGIKEAVGSSLKRPPLLSTREISQKILDRKDPTYAVSILRQLKKEGYIIALREVLRRINKDYELMRAVSETLRNG